MCAVKSAITWRCMCSNIPSRFEFVSKSCHWDKKSEFFFLVSDISLFYRWVKIQVRNTLRMAETFCLVPQTQGSGYHGTSVQDVVRWATFCISVTFLLQGPHSLGQLWMWCFPLHFQQTISGCKLSTFKQHHILLTCLTCLYWRLLLEIKTNL